uniref:Uncharacterized protein n=1 Tax=Amphimedon queenslandica TaxID=400682 RepID=A0A1X7TVM1_AMPQE
MAENAVIKKETILAGYTPQELQNFMNEDNSNAGDLRPPEHHEEEGDEDEDNGHKELSHLTKLVLTIALLVQNRATLCKSSLNSTPWSGSTRQTRSLN